MGRKAWGFGRRVWRCRCGWGRYDHGKGQELGKSLVQDHDKESKPRAAR